MRMMRRWKMMWEKDRKTNGKGKIWEREETEEEA